MVSNTTGPRSSCWRTPSTSDDVLEDLRQRVKSWDLTLAGRRSLIANTRWIHSAPPETGRHVYKLFIDLVNNGLEKIDEWKAEVWFPSEYIEGADRTQEFVYLRESDTDYSEEARRIWPGDPPRPAFNIDYFVNNENWPGRPLWPGEKRAERQVRLRVSGGDQPWERTIPIRALQNF